MKKVLALLAVQAAVLAAVGFIVYKHRQHLLPPPPIPLRDATMIVKPASMPTSPALRDHPVIPGGIHSLAQLLELIKKHPALYVGIDVDSLHAIVVDHDFTAFVQYSRDGKTFWTTRRVTIHAGETLYVDKNGRAIRGECGNELSAIPMSPTAVDIEPIDTEGLIVGEPPADVPFTLPETGQLPIPSEVTPIGENLPGDILPFFPPIWCCGGGGGGPVPPQPPVTTPEPDTLWLTGAGVFFLMFLVKYLSRSRDAN